MLKRFSTFLAASALVTLAACGGDEGPNWADEVDAETAAGAGELAADMATSVSYAILNGDMSSELPIGLVKGTDSPTLTERSIALVRRQLLTRTSRPELSRSPSPFRVSAECQADISGALDSLGAPLDTDEDGVPNDMTISFPAGCTEVDGDITYTYSGSFRFRDVAGLYGIRMDVNNLRFRAEDASGYEQFTADGDETLVYSSSAVTHEVDMTQSARLHATGAVTGAMASAAFTLDESFRWIEDAAYDPDGTIALESDIPNGDLTFTIDMRLQLFATDGEESEEYAFRFTMATTDPLAIDNVTCYGPTDGTIVGDLNGNDAVGFTINWSACDTYVVTVRGTTEPEGPVLE
jgi:hypothetical protein